MTSKRKFWRRVYEVEVLSEHQIPDCMSLQSVVNESIEGDYSMQSSITSEDEIDAATVATKLLAQGSDPEFFRVDKDGNDLEEAIDL